MDTNRRKLVLYFVESADADWPFRLERMSLDSADVIRTDSDSRFPPNTFSFFPRGRLSALILFFVDTWLIRRKIEGSEVLETLPQGRNGVRVWTESAGANGRVQSGGRISKLKFLIDSRLRENFYLYTLFYSNQLRRADRSFGSLSAARKSEISEYLQKIELEDRIPRDRDRNRSELFFLSCIFWRKIRVGNGDEMFEFFFCEPRNCRLDISIRLGEGPDFREASFSEIQDIRKFLVEFSACNPCTVSVTRTSPQTDETLWVKVTNSVLCSMRSLSRFRLEFAIGILAMAAVVPFILFGSGWFNSVGERRNDQQRSAASSLSELNSFPSSFPRVEVHTTGVIYWENEDEWLRVPINRTVSKGKVAIMDLNYDGVDEIVLATQWEGFRSCAKVCAYTLQGTELWCFDTAQLEAPKFNYSSVLRPYWGLAPVTLEISDLWSRTGKDDSSAGIVATCAWGGADYASCVLALDLEGRLVSCLWHAGSVRLIKPSESSIASEERLFFWGDSNSEIGIGEEFIFFQKPILFALNLYAGNEKMGGVYTLERPFEIPGLDWYILLHPDWNGRSVPEDYVDPIVFLKSGECLDGVTLSLTDSNGALWAIDSRIPKLQRVRAGVKNYGFRPEILYSARMGAAATTDL